MLSVCVSFFDTIVSYLVGLGKPGYNILAHELKCWGRSRGPSFKARVCELNRQGVLLRARLGADMQAKTAAATDDAVRSSERGLS